MCKDRQKGLGDEVNLSSVRKPPLSGHPLTYSIGEASECTPRFFSTAARQKQGWERLGTRLA